MKNKSEKEAGKGPNFKKVYDKGSMKRQTIITIFNTN